MTTTSPMRNHPRFATRADIPIVASISADGKEFRGVVTDLSFSGARIELANPIACESNIRLEMRCPTAGFDLDVEAVVRWCRSLEGGLWNLGVQFTKVLSEGRIADLFARGVLNRRRDQRVDLKHETLAQFESTDGATPVELLNIGVDGCCLVSQVECQVGQNVRFPAPYDESEILVAEVGWVQRFEDRSLAGCRFLDGRGREGILGLLDRLRSRPEQKIAWLSLATVAAAVVAAAVATFALTG